MKTLEEQYRDLYGEILVPIARQLEVCLKNLLQECSRIDSVTARAKSPDRFLAKATKKSNGDSYYPAPLQDIQDQIGARVTVLYLSDVDSVSKVVERYLKHREIKVKTPNSAEEFSYFGKHFILELPPDAVPAHIAREVAPEVFELQIKTLFQHAWSEANHELGYKPQKLSLTPDQRRLLAYSSAQAWGADRVFEELQQELSSAG
jgi:putative GTP pyrophosphokinase